MADETTAPATGNSSNPEPKKPESAAPADAASVPALKPIELPAAPESPTAETVQVPAIEPVPQAPVPRQAANSPVPSIVVPPKSLVDAPAPSAADKLFGGNVVSEKPIVAPEPLIPVTERAEMRTLREVGIAERPETAKEAPARPELAGGADESAQSARVVRTYAADMAEEIKKRGETLSTIVSAEQLKKDSAPAAPVSETERKNRVMLLLGAALFVIAGFAVVAGVILLATAPKAPSYTETTLIPANITHVVSHDAAKSLINELAAERTNAQMSLGEVENIPVSENGAPVSAQDILSDMGAPDLLARNALETMVGLHAFNRTQPFILIRVSAYDLAFQAMLQWETTISRDLGAFFAPSGPTAANTPPAPFTFVDRVSQNVDTRVSDPSWPILYAFPQKDLLLITTNESTLKEVLSRLASGHSGN